ncbi:hypothetical protein WDU94_013010 [Cyamophila willieti]
MFAGIQCVQITDLRVPSLVKNGSSSYALLDCEYSLSQEESGPNSGLVVKWFFNDRSAPVYQWIPGKDPQGWDILKGRLNLGYKASSHKSTMHRALYIINPTTELSGNYKCVVSTFDDEDFMNKKMIVYGEFLASHIITSNFRVGTCTYISYYTSIRHTFIFIIFRFLWKSFLFLLDFFKHSLL